jgi:hypothetical protein
MLIPFVLIALFGSLCLLAYATTFAPPSGRIDCAKCGFDAEGCHEAACCPECGMAWRGSGEPPRQGQRRGRVARPLAANLGRVLACAALIVLAVDFVRSSHFDVQAYLPSYVLEKQAAAGSWRAAEIIARGDKLTNMSDRRLRRFASELAKQPSQTIALWRQDQHTAIVVARSRGLLTDEQWANLLMRTAALSWSNRARATSDGVLAAEMVLELPQIPADMFKRESDIQIQNTGPFVIDERSMYAEIIRYEWLDKNNRVVSQGVASGTSHITLNLAQFSGNRAEPRIAVPAVIGTYTLRVVVGCGAYKSAASENVLGTWQTEIVRPVEIVAASEWTIDAVRDVAVCEKIAKEASCRCWWQNNKTLVIAIRPNFSLGNFNAAGSGVAFDAFLQPLDGLREGQLIPAGQLLGTISSVLQVAVGRNEFQTAKVILRSNPAVVEPLLYVHRVLVCPDIVLEQVITLPKEIG